MQGTSRGNAKIHEIVDRLALWGISMLFVIGGNGGNAAAHAIAQECERQGVVCSVVGVPKSIDNDIQLIDRCFGFDTSVEEAQRPLVSAAVEARSAAGISIVKLMVRPGRWRAGPEARKPGRSGGLPHEHLLMVQQLTD